MTPRTWNLLEIVRQNTLGVRLFVNKEGRQKDIEITPFLKGSLWKIKYDGRAWRVLYGTEVKVWCDKLSSALIFIDKENAPFTCTPS